MFCTLGHGKTTALRPGSLLSPFLGVESELWPRISYAAGFALRRQLRVRHSCVSCSWSVQVQKKLSDKDRRLVQTNMLVGIAPELIGNTADEIVAISTGRDHFVVQGVLRSGDP